MKRPITTVIALTLLLGALAWASWERLRPEAPASESEATLRLGERVFQLEISATPEARALGLGERASLCQQCGMLFSFEEAERLSFWMRGMRFPLDIIWLLDNRVVHVEENVSPEATQTFFPPTPANQVIELNAGQARGLEAGEVVDLEIP